MDVATQGNALYVALTAHTSSSANAPGAASSAWMGLGMTLQQATESAAGIVQVASSAEIQNFWNRMSLNGENNKVLTLSRVKAITNPITVTLYVDDLAGNDSNPGTSAAPFKTIQAAISSLGKSLGASCTIRVQTGTYTISSPISISGIVSGTLAIAGADNNNRPIITNVSGSLGGNEQGLMQITDCSHVYISGLEFRYAGTRTGANSAIYAKYVNFLRTAQNVYSGDFRYGIQLRTMVANAWNQSSTFNDLYAGIIIADGAFVSGWFNTFNNCTYEASVGGGIYAPNSSVRNNTGLPSVTTAYEFYASQYPYAALKAANDPSANNPIATMADVNNLLTQIQRLEAKVG